MTRGQDLRHINPNIPEVLQEGKPIVLSFNGLYMDRFRQPQRHTAINWFIKGDADIAISGDSCTVQANSNSDPSELVRVFCVSRLDGRIFSRDVVLVKTPEAPIEEEADVDVYVDEE